MAFQITVFVVMAALLAWVLGGTLFPRPAVGLQDGEVQMAGWDWCWEAQTSPEGHAIDWYLVRRPMGSDEGPWSRVSGGGPFAAVEPLQATGPLESSSGQFTTRVWIRTSPSASTTLTVHADGRAIIDQSVATVD